MSYNLYSNPKLRVAANGVNPCGSNEIKVYRSKDGNNFSVIPNSYLRNFNGDGEYNRKDAIFIDTWAGN